MQIEQCAFERTVVRVKFKTQRKSAEFTMRQKHFKISVTDLTLNLINKWIYICTHLNWSLSRSVKKNAHRISRQLTITLNFVHYLDQIRFFFFRKLPSLQNKAPTVSLNCNKHCEMDSDLLIAPTLCHQTLWRVWLEEHSPSSSDIA